MNAETVEASTELEAVLEDQLKAWRDVRRGAGNHIAQLEKQLARLRGNTTVVRRKR